MTGPPIKNTSLHSDIDIIASRSTVTRKCLISGIGFQVIHITSVILKRYTSNVTITIIHAS